MIQVISPVVNGIVFMNFTAVGNQVPQMANSKNIMMDSLLRTLKSMAKLLWQEGGNVC